MKKITGLLFLIILYVNSAYAELTGVKEFYLSIEHDGSECNGEKFDKEIETSAKYILGNSKIKLTDDYNSAEVLSIYVLTGSSDNLCASSLDVYSWSLRNSKNSSGHEFLALVNSYTNQRITANTPQYAHKENVINAIELMLKEFVVKWNEDNK